MAIIRNNTAPRESTFSDESELTKPSRWALMGRALRSRNYRLFFFGQMVSLMGSWMTQIATSWLVWSLSGSPLLLGIVGFAGQIPAFLLSPIAGVFVDRLSRHRVLVVTQALAMIQSLLLAFLTLTGLVTIWQIILLMIFQGLINGFDMPARQAFVVEMVEDPDDLPNAIALNSSLFNAARIVGPGVAAIILAASSAGWCFLVDGISYIGVIVSLLMMVVPKFQKKERENPLLQLREGFKYTVGFPPIRALILLIAGMSLIGMPYSVLLPVVATKILHGSSGMFALLGAVSGMGALAGALVLAARESVRGLTRMIPYCTMGFGLALVIFSHSNFVWLSLIAIFLMGYAMMTQNAASNTVLQTIVEPDKRGRVMSFYMMAFMGMMPLGSLWSGAVAERIGTQHTLLLCGLGCIAMAALFARHLPRVANLIRPIYQQMGIIPEVASGLENTAELIRPSERQG